MILTVNLSEATQSSLTGFSRGYERAGGRRERIYALLPTRGALVLAFVFSGSGQNPAQSSSQGKQLKTAQKTLEQETGRSGPDSRRASQINPIHQQ